MTEKFDVIVVGARCAGSPLAASLAARGLRVCVLDRSRFPSDVASTHLIQPSGVAHLRRLGLLEKVLATGAPPLERGGFVLDDVHLDINPAIAARFEAPMLCVRRITLDSLLVDAAMEAGADVRTETAVTGLVTEDGVVRGVQTKTGTIRAPLVVGADGPHSSVARFVGARDYHVTAPGRMFLWAYFEGAVAPEGHASLGKVGDLAFLSAPTDNDLFMVGLAPSMSFKDAYMADVERSFSRDVAHFDELDGFIGPAKRVGPIRTMTRWQGYFREATGPGWVLIGDAGHFKDPTPAQGISDALRQAERLSEVIGAGLGGSDLSGRLADWWRWRDDDAWDMYWFATDMGAPGPNPRIITEVVRSLSQERNGTEQFLRVLNHDVSPSTLMNPSRGLRSLVRLATHPTALLRVAVETPTIVAGEAQRRRLQRRPDFATESAAREPLADALT
jgi:menaquinone-9 beta-reductase